MSLASGTLLGAYDIVSLIGVGGMGEVYRARDAKLVLTFRFIKMTTILPKE